MGRLILGRWVGDLYPGSFALVMATGIVSIACHLAGLVAVAWALFWVNHIAYTLLWLLTLARLLGFLPKVVADIADPGRGPGFLTMVAGTSVLSRQLSLLAGNDVLALALAVAATLLWALLIYGFLVGAILRPEKPPPGRWVDGAWLLAVVATQSVSLAWVGARSVLGLQDPIFLLMLALHLLGYVLYLVLIGLILYQFVAFRLDPTLLTPTYWINMGAMAITTLAGAVLVSLAPESALLQAVLPFLQGLTILAWAVATWWIPLLVVLFAWRHLVGKVGLYYDPQYWSMVFPLGMYSVCTFRLAQVTGFAFLQHLSQAFAYVAVAAWAAVFMGLARHILGELQSAPVVRWEEADQPADLPPDNGPSPH
jgi:tellurite resistance protein TehA-like permease